MAEEKTQPSHTGVWCAAVLGALVLYVGSYGPIVGLFCNGTILPSASSSARFVGFYKPLKWMRKYPPMNKAMYTYAHWWSDALTKPGQFPYGYPVGTSHD